MPDTFSGRRHAFLLGLGALLPGLAAAADKPKYRVVFQVSDNDPKKWKLTLNNIQNASDELGAGNLQVELVVYGPGLDMLLVESEVGGRVMELNKKGVNVLACEHTMQANKLSKDDLVNGVSTVRAGVAQIIQRQAEGWAYMRA